MTRWVPLLALALLGCGRNAIFELELELPEAPAGAPLYAVVVAGLEGDEPGPALDGIPLQPGCGRAEPPPPCALRTLDPACSEVVSVVSDTAPVDRPLAIRIRFCDDPGCVDDAAPPEHRVRVERAFYEGRYTQGRVCVDAVPAEAAPEPERIERCEVRCREGTAAMSCRLDGTHFCE